MVGEISALLLMSLIALRCAIFAIGILTILPSGLAALVFLPPLIRDERRRTKGRKNWRIA